MGASFFTFRSAFQASGLTVHVLDNDVIDLAEASAVLKDLPGFVSMVMDLDRIPVLPRLRPDRRHR